MESPLEDTTDTPVVEDHMSLVGVRRRVLPSSVHSPLDDDGGRKLKRSVKPLPLGLDHLGPRNLSGIHCALELSRSKDKTVEHAAAQYVDFIVPGSPGETSRLDLKKDLNLCQLRRFCRQLGIKQTASSNKDGCRRAIALLIEYEKELITHGVHPRSTESRSRNTLLRAVNVVFSSCFIDRFLCLNDLKNRVDHETGNMLKDFWVDAALAHNELDVLDVDLEVNLHGDDEGEFKALLDDEDFEVDLTDVDLVTDSLLQKKIMTMVKIRLLIKKNMGISGTHSSRVLDFLDNAINKTKGGRMLNRVGVYYFYLRANEYGEALDSAFQPFLPKEAEGSTVPDVFDVDGDLVDNYDDGSPTPNTIQQTQYRKQSPSDVASRANLKNEVDKAIGAMTMFGEESRTFTAQMERANNIEEQRVKMEEQKMKLDEGKMELDRKRASIDEGMMELEKKRTKMEVTKMKIEIAKAIGDIDILKQLLLQDFDNA